MPPSIHGTRAAYQRGCGCMACRAANAAYLQAHRQVAGVVSAEAARLQLDTWRQLGIGHRQAATVTGLAVATVAAVRSGRLRTIRASTAARILQARPTLAAGALVPATVSWRTVDSLERDGFTRRELGFRLGARSQQLQLGRRRVRASTAATVAALYQRWSS